MKKAYNTPGTVKSVHAPNCGNAMYGGWSYPLKLVGRPISFDARGDVQVRYGDFWENLKVSKTARTFVSGPEAIRFCGGGKIPLTWE